MDKFCIDSTIQSFENSARAYEEEAQSWIADGWQEAFEDLTPEKEAEMFKYRQSEQERCLRCAMFEEQMASWLKELRELRSEKKGTGAKNSNTNKDVIEVLIAIIAILRSEKIITLEYGTELTQKLMKEYEKEDIK